jgi:uncharacterized 2Fe-2S/4Fe-4S cluster protein (DUF4445 family)
MEHFRVQFLPEGREVLIHAGATLLEAAGQAGIVLTSPCGGRGTCGKCRVRVEPGGREVLACQTAVREDLTVIVPQASRHLHQQVLEHGILRQMHIEPEVRKVYIEEAAGPAEALARRIEGEGGFRVTVSEGLRGKEIAFSNGTAVLRSADGGYELLNVEKGDTTAALYGAAFDIGTTTVVLRLVDLNSGEVITTVSASNPQSRHGDDVISRIHYADGPEGLETLHGLIAGCLNGLLKEACEKAGIERGQVYEAAACGNTAMHHLLLKYPVRSLGQAPYHAVSTAAESREASTLGLEIHADGRLHTLANIAGFVGSDTVAAALAAGMDRVSVKTLLVDIGTNGEIVAGTRQRLAAASCAAGPALEGAGILHGSRAVGGAIQRVLVNGDDIDLDVIGGGKAAGICGSGLIDAAALLLELGIYDATGRFLEAGERKPLPPLIERRCVEYNGQPAFVLAWSGDEPRVLLTQRDVRMLQLAKAAIRAGIYLLLKKLGIAENELEQVYLAGAFGNYIDKASAVRIGLLPEVGMEKIQSLGNAAADGVHMVLLSAESRRLGRRLAESIEHVEIAHSPEFQERFSECMFFPEGK